jgi:hypothetical protein
MGARGDHYRKCAAEAEATAAEVKFADVRYQFLVLARHWRELAQETDEYEASIGRYFGASGKGETRPDS